MKKSAQPQFERLEQYKNICMKIIFFVIILSLSMKGYTQEKASDNSGQNPAGNINFGIDGPPSWLRNEKVIYATNPLLILKGVRYDYNSKTSYPPPPAALDELLKGKSYNRIKVVISKQEMSRMKIDPAYTSVLIVQ